MTFRHLTRLALVIVGMGMALGQSAMAQTRLGLHVTREELIIWQSRRTDNVNGIGGKTYKSIWDNRILPDANTFKGQSHPGGDGSWTGWTGSGCYPDNQNNPAGRNNGRRLMASAFVYLVTGDVTYADPVKTELLNQIGQAGTDWTNTTKWCESSFDGNAIEVIPWITHLLFAYDYLKAGGYTGFTTQNKTNVENWFHNAALYWERRASRMITTQRFSKGREDPPVYTCDGWACPSSTLGTTHWQGNKTTYFDAGWNNRVSTTVMFAAPVAIMVNNSTLLQRTKWWYQEFLRFSSWTDGSVHDQYRWSDAEGQPAGAGSSWTHAAYQWGPALTIADHVARTGDVSLYDHAAPLGLFGTGGGSNSLLNVIRHVARMANGTKAVYGTTSGQLDAAHLLTWNVEGGHSEDVIMALANIYYRNTEVTTAYTRTMNPTSGCGGYNCYGPPWGIYPDILFMFGGMEGKVWPYSSDPNAGPDAPTNLRIVAP
jgi:hypothetical protein